ncbi:MAG: tryptophan--tRNA ligase [Candidatus Colwellbacteria bacterium]|nr:tryptophan--tRNA ligase [Candidatus Colwellbacteria bacterium]
MAKILVSGLKPSGTLHLGNYLGMLKQAVVLQEKSYRRFYFIADYHSLTLKYKASEKAKEIFEMAVDALAAGLDPKKSTIFIQSHIKEHANLTWIFNNITSVGELTRMVEYKEKVAQGQVPNAGLLDYPVLMAADILVYKGEVVPVGEDQLQHLELSRTIARTFNNRFGKTFPEPKAILTKAPRIMSLADPKQKMSKSISRGCLFLTDSAKVIKEKVAAAQTDSHKEISYDPEKRPGISNLVLIYAELTNSSPIQLVKKFKGVGYREFKSELARVIDKEFKPFRENRKKLLANKSKVVKILEAGAKQARPVAEATMAEVRRKVGLI